MKSYTTYVCDTCGFESKDSSLVYACEANHLGLTVAEKHQYDDLNKAAEYAGQECSLTKNAENEEAFDKAVKALLAFEKLHHLI